MFLKTATIALLPALLFQGYHVKKNTLRLPEPEGLRHGKVGKGKNISILIIGDSAAAGVGVQHQDDALSGAILADLQNEFQIEWLLHAKTGNTSDQVIASVADLPQTNFDVIITSVGVNDVTQLMSATKWIQRQQKLYQMLEAKFDPKFIIATGVPPMQMFPALPNPLGWLFGQYASSMNKQLKNLIQNNSKMALIEYDIQQYQALGLDMAEDGFHPSKGVYKLWAKNVADKIRQKFS